MTIVAKLVYTVILLGVTAMALRELYTVWLDPTITLGTFSVIGEAGADDAATSSMPQRILAAQAALAQRLHDYELEAQDDPSTQISEADLSWRTASEVSLPDITYQGINITQILTNLRNTLRAPNEIYGTLTVEQGTVMGVVEWPQWSADAYDLSRFVIPPRATLQGATEYIACTLFWGHLADDGGHRATRLRPDDFCTYAEVLEGFYNLRTTYRTGAPIDGELDRLRNWIGRLAALNDDDAFPDVLRLRADCLELLSEASPEPNPEALNQAQEARLVYAENTSMRDVSDDTQRRVRAEQLVQPRSQLVDGQPSNPLPPTWTEHLAQARLDVALVARSTASIDADGRRGTGFVIAPGKILFSAQLLDGVPSSITACFADIRSGCTTPLDLEDLERIPDADLVLATLTDPEANAHPPLQLGRIAADLDPSVAPFGATVAYGAREKWLMLGRMTGPRRMPWPPLHAAADMLMATFRVPTTQGYIGGPVVDVSTGRVVGMLAGEVAGNAVAVAFTSTLLAELRTRVYVGEDDQASP